MYDESGSPNLGDYIASTLSSKSKIVKNIIPQTCLNQIFKKILLENNRCNENKFESQSILSSPLEKNKNLHKTRILICSDANLEEEVDYDQKLAFLMKRQGIYTDCLSIGLKGEYLNKLKSLAYYTDGLYEHITIDNLPQTLLQMFLPMPDDRKNIKSLFSIQQGQIQPKNLECDECKSKTESQYIMTSDNREISCKKCYQEKSKRKTD